MLKLSLPRLTINLLLFLSMGLSLSAQHLDVDGKARISEMDTITTSSTNLVLQPDGTLAIRRFEIGDTAQGGIIFWVDESGEHGLVCDTVDLSTGIRWHAGTFGDTQANGDGPFSGEMNTAIIISSHVAIGDDGNSYAARLCAEHERAGYGDWYLPSRKELDLMYTNLHQSGIGNFESEVYWTSDESTSTTAWFQNFAGGNQSFLSKVNLMHVRAIRAF